MTVAALVVYVAGLLLVFGLRTYLAWRRHGDGGLRRPIASPGQPDRWATVAFGIAGPLGLATPVVALTGLVPPTPGVSGAALGIVGLLAMVVGLVVIVVAQAGMGSSWRIGVDPSERTELVTTGLFAHVRHPIYTGMVVVLLGLLLAVPTVLSAAALVVVVVAVQLKTRLVEEPYLLATHEGYAAYAARSGRFVPGIGRIRSAGNPR